METPNAAAARPALRTAVRGRQQPDPSQLAAKLRIRNLNFYYGDFHALHDISLDIPENRVTAFIGPSGSGKSTLLRTLNRMYSLYPDQRADGEHVLHGVNMLDINPDLPLLRSKIGM